MGKRLRGIVQREDEVRAIERGVLLLAVEC